MRDPSRHIGYPFYEIAGRGIENVHGIIAIAVPGPAAADDVVPIRRDGNRIDLALMTLAYGHPKDPHKLPRILFPYPDGLVIGTGDEISAVRVHGDAPYAGGMHSGLDPQRRLI